MPLYGQSRRSRSLLTCAFVDLGSLCSHYTTERARNITKYHRYQSITTFFSTLWVVVLLKDERTVWRSLYPNLYFPTTISLNYYYFQFFSTSCHYSKSPFLDSTLCPKKSDIIADFLITCNNLYRIKYNFINIYLHVLQTVMQSFWKIHLSVTQKSNCKRNDKRGDCTTIQ